MANVIQISPKKRKNETLLNDTYDGVMDAMYALKLPQTHERKVEKMIDRLIAEPEPETAILLDPCDVEPYIVQYMGYDFADYVFRLLADYREDILEIQEENEKLQTEYDGLNAENRSLQNVIEKLEYENEDSKTECLNLREKNSDLQTKNEKLLKDNTGYNNRQANMSKLITKLKNGYGQLRNIKEATAFDYQLLIVAILDKYDER